MDIALSRIPQDGRFSIKMENKEINIRTSTIPTIYGENMVIRLLDTSSSISLNNWVCRRLTAKKWNPW